MKITPSARVLRMLGEIDFDEWQCVAELIDNAFDDFTEIRRAGMPWADGFRVSVQLPSQPGGELVVSDTGRGMSYDRLESSVRAGWTGNDPHGKLGLFGMGFNVATARLGRRTRVLTTRQGDPEWIGVEIDLDRIKDDFEVDDIAEPKGDVNEHGTRIVVDHLQRDRADWLRRNAAAVRNTLGGVYSWLLAHEPFELWVAGIRVKPVRHCRWGDDRYVIYNGKERIPAYIEIDEKLEDGLACSVCGQWEVHGESRCASCGGDRLVQRARRVHGWVGIQRYLHKREYGIDFLRNGRKILRWDKQLFTWRNPDGSAGNEEPEYPAELAHQGGRIIGEIHLDHVPVTYQKDAFQYGDRSWRSAVEILRGRGPLLPQRANQLNYPENKSPLGLLFKGFRRTDAGERYLIPGDGKNPIHDDTRRWGRQFQSNDPEYQTDDRWWQAVLDHERAKKQGKDEKASVSTPRRPDEDAVLQALGVQRAALPPGEPAASGGSGSPTAAPGVTRATPGQRPTGRAHNETRQERHERYLATSVTYPELSRSVGHPLIGFLEIDGRRITEGALTDDDGNPAPIVLEQRRGNQSTAFVDVQHEVFWRFGIEPADLLVLEAAAVLKVQTGSPLKLSQLVADIKKNSFPDAALESRIISADAKELLQEIRARMAAAVDKSGQPDRAFDFLSDDERTETEKRMIAQASAAAMKGIGKSGGFLMHVPPLFLVKLLEGWPEAFMDGHVFNNPYATITSEAARRLSLAHVVGCFSEVARQASFDGPDQQPMHMAYTRLSTRLLADALGD